MSEQASKGEPNVKVLEEKLLHHLMVTFNRPSRWPSWTIGLITLLFGAMSALAWSRLGENPDIWKAVGVIQTLFMWADQATLISLPKKGISFGSWKAQFLALALPRFAATLLMGLVSFLFGWQWGAAGFLMIQIAGTAALVWGAIIEPMRLGMSTVELITDRLPRGTKAIRLLHISDLHVERLTRREDELLRLVREAEPDVIFVTGDYVNLSYNRDPQTHAQVKQLLGQLSAPGGVYATLGSPPVDLREMVVPIFDGLQMPLMRENWEEVDLGEGRRLVVLGMDCTHHLPTDASRLDRLVESAPNGVPQVLLYHSPELMPQAAGHGIDLYLCGHTHGGQVRLPLVGPMITSSQLGRKYVMGLYVKGRTSLYVSRGVGLEGLGAPRVRFLSPPEITLLTLAAPQ